MKIKRLYDFPVHLQHEFKLLLKNSYDNVLYDIKNEISEFYKINDCYVGTFINAENLEVTILYGKNCDPVIRFIIEQARIHNIKTVNAWTCKKGMTRMFEKWGGVKTNTYTEYTIKGLYNA